MCGIIGYVGKKQATGILVNGLKRLEYRGYDSSGVAVVCDDKIDVVKMSGKVARLEQKLKEHTPVGTIGIGHTRWATHGVPNDINSHPQSSNDGRFVIVHNGIIENYAELKTRLTERGYSFKSETDTEVMAVLLQELYTRNIVSTLSALMKELKGSYAVGIICADAPDRLYAIRKDNPLVVALGNGENFIASDFPAALEYTHEFVLLNDCEIAEIERDTVNYYDANGKPIKKKSFTVNWDISQAEKGGYDHFMLKEIYDQPKALADTLNPRVNGNEIDLDGIKFDKEYLDGLTDIDILGCGSAYHAGIVGKTFIEKHCRIRVRCELASEYIYSDPIADRHTLTMIISQSGETADTLEALRLAKSRGSRTIAIVNVMQSIIAREADDVLYTHAGPEIAVATTKGYTTQVAALYLVGLKIAALRGTVSQTRYNELLSELLKLPDLVREQLKDYSDIAELSKRFAHTDGFFFIGRGTDYAASLEGALKLKEISYIRSEAYAAGELKHGTISLIEEGTVTLALVTQTALYHQMLSNIRQIQSRGGTVLAIASRPNSKIKSSAPYTVCIPKCDDDVSPVLTAVVLQLYAYHVAVELGRDIDQPRNLAKSVTVQ
ncbi:MAG: glutamine--fructose-6-phosphate transaminase (isomerizing) [Roseburia sp.]|nr:glutamine--fructose-6-phosphate transaminase (isomerizing) [Roseburia sp.]